jgi:hypothetical protein
MLNRMRRGLRLGITMMLAAGVLLMIPAWSRADAPAKPARVPFELLASKHMAVNVKINGKGPYRLIFDTGAPITLLSNKAAKEAGVLPKDARPPLFAVFGSMGQFPIQTLEVEGLKADKVNTIVMDHPAVTALSRALGPIEGIVGFPFFARYTMTIDYQAKEMTFVPNGYEPADILETLTATLMTRQKPPPQVLAPAGAWGLVVSKEGDDEDAGVRVDRVRPGSAAAQAGIRPGDRLLTIAGRWTDSVQDCYRAADSVPANTAAPVAIRREGKEMRTTVTPRRGL